MTVQGEGKFEITQSKYRLTEEQKQDEGQKLFDFCAECLKTFIDGNFSDSNGGLSLKKGETLPLGFTVSYNIITWVRNTNNIISSRTLARKHDLITGSSACPTLLPIDRKGLIMVSSFAGPKVSAPRTLKVTTSPKCSVNPWKNMYVPSVLKSFFVKNNYGPPCVCIAITCDTHCPHQ